MLLVKGLTKGTMLVTKALTGVAIGFWGAALLIGGLLGVAEIIKSSESEPKDEKKDQDK